MYRGGQTEEKGVLVCLKTVAMGATETQLIQMHLLLTRGYRGKRCFEKANMEPATHAERLMIARLLQNSNRT